MSKGLMGLLGEPTPTMGAVSRARRQANAFTKRNVNRQYAYAHPNAPKRPRRQKAPSANRALMKLVNQGLFNPVRPLQGKQLGAAVNALVNLQVRPQMDALRLQERQATQASKKVTGNAKSYYNGLNDYLKSLADQSHTAAEDTAAREAAAVGQVQNGSAAMATADQNRVDQDAAVRGDIARTASEALAQSLAQRAASDQTRASADQTAANTHASAGEQNAIGAAQAGGLRGGEQLKQLTDRFAQQIQGLQQQEGTVNSSRGQLAVDALTKLRQQGFDNAVTMKGLGLKEKDLELNAKTNAARIKETNRHNLAMEGTAAKTARLTDKKYQLDLQKFGHQKAVDRYMKRNHLGSYSPKTGKGSGGSKGGPTWTQREGWRQNSLDFWDKVDQAAGPDGVIDQAKSALGGVNATRKKNNQPPIQWNDDTIRQLLQQKGYSGYEIDAILEIRNQGAVSPSTLKKLKARHINVPKKRQARRGDGKAYDFGSMVGSIVGDLFG